MLNLIILCANSNFLNLGMKYNRIRLLKTKRIKSYNDLFPQTKLNLGYVSNGKQYKTKHYNLQATISVGFKVNNERAVQFRKWAGQIVKDYTIQGWVIMIHI